MKKRDIPSILTLFRIPLSLFAACSATTGFVLGPRHHGAGALLLTTAVFLLACGASALNQYQEREIDAKMERTKRRPLPSRAISPGLALSFSRGLIVASLALLALAGGITAAGLGVLAVLWYNGLYTALKRITAFASVPGAVVGMIPPAIGWVSAGGSLTDPRLFAVSFVFFMWQIPHFWLQILHHGEDYEQAGLPSLTQILSRTQIARITFVWICSSTVTSLLLPLYGALTSPLLYFSLLFTAVLVIIKSVKLVTAERTPALSLSAFRQLNAFIFILMSLLSVEKMFIHIP
jgi:protoheme IX farnesyltransferase